MYTDSNLIIKKKCISARFQRLTQVRNMVVAYACNLWGHSNS